MNEGCQTYITRKELKIWQHAASLNSKAILSLCGIVKFVCQKHNKPRQRGLNFTR